MDLQKDIKKLVTYGLDKKLIMPEDEIYTINQYLEVFRLDEYEDPDIEGEEIILPEILDRLTDVAYDRYIIKSDDIVTRDLFDTKLMNCIMPRPSQVQENFWKEYAKSPEDATKFYYDFSQNSNYIRRDRIKKDMKWVVPSEYGDIDITINLSKPEKDPKAIAAAKVVAANIDEYLGYHHIISCDVEIPEARLDDRPPCGRVNMTEREACERVCDFNGVENCMSEAEAKQEASRCLRCDHFGYGIFKGGRETLW